MAAFSMIVLILLQRSEGGALGMGGGGGGFVSGRAAANFLTKVTAALAAIFFITSLSLGVLSHRTARTSAVGGPRKPRRLRLLGPGEAAPAKLPDITLPKQKAQSAPASGRPRDAAASAVEIGRNRRSTSGLKSRWIVARRSSRKLVSTIFPHQRTGRLHDAVENRELSLSPGVKAIRCDSMARYIFITGGVVSSLGKGLASAALGALLKARATRCGCASSTPISTSIRAR